MAALFKSSYGWGPHNLQRWPLFWEVWRAILHAYINKNGKTQMHFPLAWGYQLIYKCNAQVIEVIMIGYKDELKKILWIIRDDPIFFLIWPTTASCDSLSAIQNENGIGWTLLLGFSGSQLVKNLPAMWKTWVRSLCLEDPLEKGMATHSIILAWRISWTEEPVGLQSMGSQRVRQDWVTKHTDTHTHTHTDTHTEERIQEM